MNNRQLKWLTYLVGSAFFLETIDGSVLNTSLKVIATDFLINPIDLKLALTSYLLTLGILMPLNNYLVAKVGEKRLFIFGNLMFFIGSLGCGLSHGLYMLISFRIIQGVGGAFLAPIARFIIVKYYDQDGRRHGMSILATLGSLGLAIGPIIGGLISTHISWRYIFFVNLPIAVIVIILSCFLMPQHQPENQKSTYDWLGFFSFAIALASTLLLLEILLVPDVSLMIKWASAISMLIAFSVFLCCAINKQPSLFSRQLLCNRLFSISLLCSFLWRLGVAAPVFLMPLYLQLYFHFTAADAGLFLLSSAIGILLSKSFITRMKNFDIHKIALLVFMLTVIFLLGFWLLVHEKALWLAIPLLFVTSFSFGFGASAINLNIYSHLRAKQYAEGTVLNGINIQLSSSFAITFVALIIFISTGTNWLDSQTIPLRGIEIAFAIMAIFPLLAFFLLYAHRHSNREPLAKRLG